MSALFQRRIGPAIHCRLPVTPRALCKCGESVALDEGLLSAHNVPGGVRCDRSLTAPARVGLSSGKMGPGFGDHK